MFIPPGRVASSGTVDIPLRMEPIAVISSLRPFGMHHGKLRKIQSAKKFFAIYNSETFLFAWLRVSLKSRQISAIDRDVAESMVQEERKGHHPAICGFVEELCELEVSRNICSARLQMVSIHAAVFGDTRVLVIVRIAFEIRRIQRMVLKEPVGNVGGHNVLEKGSEGGALELFEVSVIEGEQRCCLRSKFRMIVGIRSIKTSPLMARIILIFDFLADLQFGLKRKGPKRIDGNSIDMGAGNTSRRLEILMILWVIVTASRRMHGVRHLKLEG